MIGLGFRLGKRLKKIATESTPPQWSPLSLSPLIWCDATRLNLNNNDPVSSFTDLSGNGNHFVQATADNKPIFKTNGINGLASIESDGVDDVMKLASLGAATEWWAAVVFKVITFLEYGVIFGVDAFRPDATYKLMEQGYRGGSVENLRINAAAGVDGAAGTVHSWLVEANESSISSALGSGATATTAGDYSKLSDKSWLFARGDGYHSTMMLGELIYGVGVLSTEDKTSLFAYLDSKWGTGIP